MSQVISILEAEDGPIEDPIVFITPPANGDITDEDSGNEDEGGFADNLSGNQLRAMGEASFKVHGEKRRIGDDDSDEVCKLCIKCIKATPT